MKLSGDKIICLVGESGSGKTTLARRLESEGYNIIKSYTTRPPRHPEEWGHLFVSMEDYLKQKNFPMLAYTCFDDNHYWALYEQYRIKGTSIYIIDPEGANSLKNIVQDAEILVIYLKVDLEERVKRMRNDGRREKDIEKRLKHDSLKFKLICCDYVIDNNGNIDDTLGLVRKLLEK